MKRLPILLIAGLIAALNSEAQTGADKRYSFLNWYIKNDHPYALSDTLINIPELDLNGIKNIQLPDGKLSKSDRQAMVKQAQRNKRNRNLDTTLLKGADWKVKGNNKEETRISLPLFSIKNNVAIIYRKHYCGPLCGQDCLLVFVKRRVSGNNQDTTLPVLNTNEKGRLLRSRPSILVSE